MGSPKVLAAIDALYEAAIAPDRWPRMLQTLSEAVGGFGTMMAPLSASGGALPCLTSDNLATAATQYTAHWHQYDTPRKRTAAGGFAEGAIATDRANMSDDEIRRDPFYQEFWRGHGIGQCLGTLSASGGGGLLLVSVQRDLRKGHFQQDEIDGMALLAPHIRRAVSVSLALGEMRSQLGGLALGRPDVGVVQLDETGVVRSMNEASRLMLGDALQVSHGRPRAANREDDGRLQAAIQVARPGSEPRAGRSIALRGREGAWRLFVESSPLHREAELERLLLGPGGVLLTLRSMAPRPRNVAQRLTALGLTPKHAALAAALAEGKSLREAAEANGLTYESARTYLRIIFGILGVSRQAELVALVERVGGA